MLLWDKVSSLALSVSSLTLDVSAAFEEVSVAFDTSSAEIFLPCLLIISNNSCRSDSIASGAAVSGTEPVTEGLAAFAQMTSFPF